MRLDLIFSILSYQLTIFNLSIFEFSTADDGSLHVETGVSLLAIKNHASDFQTSLLTLFMINTPRYSVFHFDLLGLGYLFNKLFQK